MCLRIVGQFQVSQRHAREALLFLTCDDIARLVHSGVFIATIREDDLSGHLRELHVLTMAMQEVPVSFCLVLSC